MHLLIRVIRDVHGTNCSLLAKKSSRPTSLQILHLLWNPQLHYRVQSSPLLDNKRYLIYMPGQELRLRLPEYLDSRHIKVVRLSTVRTSRL